MEHIVTVYTDFYRVMAGKENYADFMTRVMLSIETAMYKDAVSALTTGLAAIPAGALNVTGAFDMATLVKMGETVQAYNYGVRPMFVGSAVALMNVIPDSTSGYRLMVDGEGGGRVDLIRGVYGFDVLRLDNVLSNYSTGALVLPEDKIFVISPSQDKLIKGVMTTSMTNSNQFFDNADLTSNYSVRKEWDFVYASAARAGVYTIQG